jgi:hypothetical protein
MVTFEKIEGKIKRGGRREGQPHINATAPFASQYAYARHRLPQVSTFTWSASVALPTVVRIYRKMKSGKIPPSVALVFSPNLRTRAGVRPVEAIELARQTRRGSTRLQPTVETTSNCLGDGVAFGSRATWGQASSISS